MNDTYGFLSSDGYPDEGPNPLIKPDPCDFPGCDQSAVVLLANDAPFLSREYAERWVCVWHKGNPFGEAGV